MKAREASRALFAGGSSASAPEHAVTEADFTDGRIDILSLLTKSGLVTSRSEARRAVEQGGVSVNGEKVDDIKASYAAEDFQNDFLLKRGKKSFAKIVIG